jgi:drug/metabolite transporter (DMT)-like permease
VQGVLWMLVAAAFFSIAAGLVRHISVTIDAFEQTFFRQLIGLLILLPFMWRRGLAGFKTRQIKVNLVRNVAGYLGISLSFLSLTLIPLADAITLQSTLPMFTIVFAAVLLGERVGLHRWSAMAVGFLGAVLILRPGFAEISVGMLVALASALCFGVSDTMARKLSSTDSTAVIVFYSFALQVPIAFAVALFNWVTPSAQDWLWLIALGLVSFGAQWGLSRAFVLAEASLVSPALFARIPLVALIGFAFFAEVPDIWTWIGAAVIFGATYYSAHRDAIRHRARASEIAGE